jgi:nicotinamide-nucleotide amidase
MNAEIIAVGSELLTPQRIDTNSLYLTDQLNALGVEVVQKSVLGDDRERLAGAILAALARSEILILTGGLGPTEDDVTRDGVAAALGRKQVFNEDVCEAIRRRFERMRRTMAEINKRQAYVIEGAEILSNPRGTAPGLWIEDHDKIIVLLPGPPPELMPMFEAECRPRLERRLPPMAIRSVMLRVAGMPESDLDQLISPVYMKYSNPVTTVLAAPGDIQIHFRAHAATAGEAQALADEVAAQVEPLLGDKIYSRNGDPLEVVAGGLLRERGATLAVAESCTGGMLGERITSVSGSSDYFVGGFLVYTDRMKERLLGVPAELLAAHTAVSREAAEAMAAGARERTGATYALSVTGVAGPSGATESNPVGTVFVGLASPDGVTARRLPFLGDRARIRALATQTALDLLRRAIAG